MKEADQTKSKIHTQPGSSPAQGHNCSGSHSDLSIAGTEASKQPLQQGVLDVRTLPPARRHSLIFQTFGELQPGKSFLLVNDHDPKPLYYQFAYEKAGAFSWNYEEQGPEVWRVRIGKTGAQFAVKVQAKMLTN
ncbi:MAG: DUF2249 domain-containing protein [Hyphomicrobiales bacterium]|nr:DUF2249 domain-containing protein [Hyphomicrobiales bacterium]